MLIPIADVPRWYAERKPKDAVAVSHGTEALSWDGLERGANRRARAFAAKGVKPGDFVAIGLINNAATILVARPTLPPSTLAELVHWMKEPGQNAKMAHPGIGSFGHLCSVLFAREIGAKADQIPYRGAGPALNDLLAGHADLGCQSAAISEPLIKAGKLKAYGIIGPRRSAGLPDLPTMGEAGYKKLDLEFWHMLLAPAGTPPEVVQKLNEAINRVLQIRDVRERLESLTFEPIGGSPQQFADYVRLEVAKWAIVVKQTGAKVE